MNSAARAAAARPSATQSGMPTDAKAAAGDEEPRLRGEPRLDRRDAIDLSDDVLRAGVRASGRRAPCAAAPAIPSSGDRSRPAIADQLVVAQIDRAGIVRAAEERAQQHRVRRARVLPTSTRPTCTP